MSTANRAARTASRAAGHVPALLLAAGALIAGCAGVPIQVQTDYNRNVDFSSLHTYAWLDSDISYTGASDPEAAAKVREIIRGTLDERLAEKGFERIDEGRPDFFVSYHVVVTELPDPLYSRSRVAILDASNPLNTGRMTIYQEDLELGSRSIRKGTLIVFFVDPDTRRLIWQGLAEGTAITPREGQQRARAAINRLMDLFPPGADRTV